MIIEQIIRINAYIEPSELSFNIDEVIKNKVHELLENKVIKNVGLVLKVGNIISIDGGLIEFHTAKTQFIVEVEVKLYSPQKKECVKGKILSIENGRIEVSNDPFSSIIASKNKNKTKIKLTDYNIDQLVIIELTQITYQQKEILLTGVLK